MNTSWTPIKTAISAALCGAAFAMLPAHGAGQDAPKPAAMKVLPGDDFYNHVNGEWMAATEIPADRSAWGASSVMSEETDARIQKLIEAVPHDAKATAEARKAAAFYNAYMDEAAIEAKGGAPLKPMLAKIDAIRDKAALNRALGASLRADVDPLNATNFFTENLFGIWVAQGLQDPAHNTPYILQGGLGMPDRAYYLSDSPKMADLRTKYQAHVAAMLKLAGYADSDARAARVLALETAIARAHASREDSADVQKANNPWTLKDFSANAPGIDWPAFFKAAKLGGQDKFIVWHPSAVKGAAALVASTELATWKDFLAFHQVNHFAPNLSKAFADEHFAFHDKSLKGTPEQSVRWKRALTATSTALPEPVGHMYVDRYFPAEDKARVRQMATNIIAAFSKRIDKLDWMAPATRAQAQAKLKSLYVGIGYPDKWQSYDGLKVVPGDAFGNAVRAEEFRSAQRLATLHGKVDRTAWAMSPQTINAVNMPMQNAINIPAGYLQAPFFDPKASDAQNYGGIGTTIGHEVSHSFDDQGAQFDAEGRLRDWWTKEDLAHFKAASAKLVAQYSAYKPFPDLAVNGNLTLSENLADLAGMGASYDAYRAAMDGKATVQTDQQFFIGNALKNRNKMREPALRQRILSNGHAPSNYRTATARNLDAWYSAFDVKPGQAL
ncbi:MAG: M13 family metallopeptidase, partial [Pseudomonadota bacterium]|nr:M13 family metallopeptidase [Pseudomonadota bacterium]